MIINENEILKKCVSIKNRLSDLKDYDDYINFKNECLSSGFEIQDDIVEEIIEKYDIVSIINKYIPLTNNRGFCPFHSDHLPSFSVNPKFKGYRCMACGAHGNVITFVQEYEKISFCDAINKIIELSN